MCWTKLQKQKLNLIKIPSLPLTDISQRGRYDEIPLWVTRAWPYVVSYTVQWKWHFGDYESVII
jgi:hypothetical protein